MYEHFLHQRINEKLLAEQLDVAGKDNLFYTRFLANASSVHWLYQHVYAKHPEADRFFDELIAVVIRAYQSRSESLRQLDEVKMQQDGWFLSHEICGMSLYVDRFCGKLDNMQEKLPYLKKLGINFLHLMPLFQSPEGESDGGYAVSDFQKVDERFGSLEDLKELQQVLQAEGMYLMLDIVLNHTSHRHEWAEKAKAGDPRYQAFYYMYPDRTVPDLFEHTMPEIFPESAPGSFTYVPECSQWVMTVFHNYQWDLNFSNPEAFVTMLDTVFFYANLGVDVLRIDAPAFIWKELGTACQNLPGAHTLLRLIRQCVQIATPGMALLGEAIVSPKEIMNYFGFGLYKARECDVAYNATQMALQWDALATADTRVMLAAQHELQRKPFGTTWINYTRCHDDIGLGYEDYMIASAGYDPFAHRQFLMNYYTGNAPGSDARGALFSANPKTGDARISGTLASLCGLEKALEGGDEIAVEKAIQKILLMQAHSIFLGGIPMLFYGDEVGYTNDYTYLNDPGKSYDNRWIHRPLIDWEKNSRSEMAGTVEQRIFSGTQKLLQLRKALPIVADYANIEWLPLHNPHLAAYIRQRKERRLFCLFNFSNSDAAWKWSVLPQKSRPRQNLYDHWGETTLAISTNDELITLKPYHFCLLEG